MLFHSAQFAKFGFNRDVAGMGRIHHALGDLDILLECLAARVNHDRAVEPALDAVHTGGLVTVVQMHRKNRVREDLVRGTDHGFEHLLVGVVAGTLGQLDDEGGLAVDVAVEQPHGLLKVVDVVRTNGILAIGMLE